MIEVSVHFRKRKTYIGGERVRAQISLSLKEDVEEEAINWALVQMQCRCYLSSRNVRIPLEFIRNKELAKKTENRYSFNPHRSYEKGYLCYCSDVQFICTSLQLTNKLPSIEFEYEEMIPINVPPTYIGRDVSYHHRIIVCLQRPNKQFSTSVFPFNVLQLRELNELFIQTSKGISSNRMRQTEKTMRERENLYLISQSTNGWNKDENSMLNAFRLLDDEEDNDNLLIQFYRQLNGNHMKNLKDEIFNLNQKKLMESIWLNYGKKSNESVNENHAEKLYLDKVNLYTSNLLYVKESAWHHTNDRLRLNFLLQFIQSLTSYSKSLQSFDISLSEGENVSVITLLRGNASKYLKSFVNPPDSLTYRLGSEINGYLSFKDSNLFCIKCLISLECHEIIKETYSLLQNYEESFDSKQHSMRVVTQKFYNCLPKESRVPFSIHVPYSSNHSFETICVNVKYRLKFDFLLSYDKQLITTTNLANYNDSFRWWPGTMGEYIDDEGLLSKTEFIHSDERLIGKRKTFKQLRLPQTKTHLNVFHIEWYLPINIMAGNPVHINLLNSNLPSNLYQTPLRKAVII
ncbi:hypothetical protein SNEBB_009763 [Seison nebaliae]|nr:hypothetical protein SNEBB_009763 [Seison nebaliae]